MKGRGKPWCPFVVYNSKEGNCASKPNISWVVQLQFVLTKIMVYVVGQHANMTEDAKQRKSMLLNYYSKLNKHLGRWDKVSGMLICCRRLKELPTHIALIFFYWASQKDCLLLMDAPGKSLGLWDELSNEDPPTRTHMKYVKNPTIQFT